MRFWPVLGGVLAGLAAGGIWTWAQPDRHRADARVLVRPASARIVPAVEALAESSLVESNVAQTLHLSPPPHISVKRGEGGVLTVSVEAGSRERARQIDAEAVAVLTQKVAERFGVSPRVTATVLDPAHVAEQTSPTPARNLLLAGLIGLAAGIAAAALTLTRRPAPAAATAVVDPRAEGRLRTRIDEVAKRERSLAKRAGELAAREKRLEQREGELTAAAALPVPNDGAVKREEELAKRERAFERLTAEREERLERREAELAARAESVEQIPDQVQPAAAPVGRWTIDGLERLVRNRREAFPARAEEWDTYVFLLREHAEMDGALPPSFDLLIADVFGDALDS